MWWDEGCHSKLTGVIFLVTKSDCSAAYPNLHPSTDTGTAVPVVLYYTSRFSFIHWCCCCGILPRGRIDHPDRARPPGRRQIRAPPPTHALGLAFPPLLKRSSSFWNQLGELIQRSTCISGSAGKRSDLARVP